MIAHSLTGPLNVALKKAFSLEKFDHCMVKVPGKRLPFEKRSANFERPKVEKWWANGALKVDVSRGCDGCVAWLFFIFC